MLASCRRPASRPICAGARFLIRWRKCSILRRTAAGRVGLASGRAEDRLRLVVAAEPERDEGVVELDAEQIEPVAQDSAEGRLGLLEAAGAEVLLCFFEAGAEEIGSGGVSGPGQRFRRP